MPSQSWWHRAPSTLGARVGGRVVTDTNIKTFEERYGRKPTSEDFTTDRRGHFVYKVDKRAAIRRQINAWAFLLVCGTVAFFLRIPWRRYLRDHW